MTLALVGLPGYERSSISWVLAILTSFWDIWQSLPTSYPLVKLKCLSGKHDSELAGRPRNSRTKKPGGPMPRSSGRSETGRGQDPS